MRDPAFLRYYYKMETLSRLGGTSVQGSSPTDVFIGSYGYPHVYVGPLIPPAYGDTSLLSSPEEWVGMSLEQIVAMRSRLVRGIKPTRVDAVEGGRVERLVGELALADRPADAAMDLESRPVIRLEAGDEVQPFGPSARIRRVEAGNLSPNRLVEKLHADTCASASTALVELYEKGVVVSRIQRALSAGLLGVGRRRRFVPTRWSITAVDDTLSKHNLEKVKRLEQSGATYAYFNNALDNRWLILLIPARWQYESIEAWYPNTVWNAADGNISIYGSYEPYAGRRRYAEIGGCYYAARLAVTEKLLELGCQAAVLILREVHEGYSMPLGVWNVREHVRQALGTKPIQLADGTKELLDAARRMLEVEPGAWVANSIILRQMLKQGRLASYV